MSSLVGLPLPGTVAARAIPPPHCARAVATAPLGPGSFVNVRRMREKRGDEK